MMCAWNKHVLHIVDERFFERSLVNIAKVFETVDVNRKHDLCTKRARREVSKNHTLTLVNTS